MTYYCGVDIGGTSTKIGLFSWEGKLLERIEIPTPKASEPTGLLEDIYCEIIKFTKTYEFEKKDILGIGILAPGPVNEDGILYGTVNIGWGTIALGKMAEEMWGISPVAIGNDGTGAALGETLFGIGVGVEDVVMITIGTGIGGGVVLKGKSIQGIVGIAGEIGHMTVNPFETNHCTCKKMGCVEQYASATGMVRMAKEVLEKEDTPSILRDKIVSAKSILDGAKKGDSIAVRIVREASKYLGIALANTCYVVDPQLIIIGGGVSLAGDFFLDMIKEEYQKQVFPHAREKAFALARLGNDAGIYGGMAMVFNSAYIAD